MAVTIQTRRDTAADWTAANPVLALGEVGIETDTDKAKYGDGFTAWNSLAYWIDQHDTVPPGAADADILVWDETGNQEWVISDLPTQLDGRYSQLGHNHDGVYSPVGHNHDGVYSPVGHNHDGVYSPVGHNHDADYVNVTGDTMTGALLAAVGTELLPGVAFAGDPDTGIFNGGANALGFATGGVERMRINSSGIIHGLWNDFGTSNNSSEFQKLTQAQYDGITPDADTIYFIVG